MKNVILAASIGLLAITAAPDRAATSTEVPLSVGPVAPVAQTSNRCLRLWRRCSRGNQRACANYRLECPLFRPIY